MTVAPAGGFPPEVFSRPWTLATEPVWSSRATPAAAPLEQRKLRRAAQEFESILIAAWWKSAAKGFSGLADEEEGGMQAFRDFGLEAMSLALAQAGGLGIGEMLVKHLGSSLRRVARQGPLETPNPAKVFSCFADRGSG